MTTANTPAKATQAAAVERGRRTLWQGLALDLGVAIAVTLLAWLPDADVASSTAWIILGTALVKSLLTALASYVMRLKVAPAREAELVDGSYVITDLDSGRQQMTTEVGGLDSFDVPPPRVSDPNADPVDFDD